MRKTFWVVWLACCAGILVHDEALAVEKLMSRALSHYIMGIMYDDLGQLDTAVEEYREALRADKEAAAIRLNLAAALIKKNDFDRAIAELKTVSRYYPEAVEPHAILALIYSSQNKLDKATSEYEAALVKATKLQPKNAAIYKNLGLMYLQQKRFKEALQIYELVVKLTPDDAQAHFILASIYHELNDADRAEAELKTSLGLDPDFHQALNFLGYLYVEQGRNLDEAEMMILKALEMEPVNGAYVDSLGWLYFKQGRLKESLEYLEKAALFLDDPVIYDHLGDAYIKLDDPPKAIESWRKSLKLDPGQEGVKKKIKQHSQE